MTGTGQKEASDLRKQLKTIEKNVKATQASIGKGPENTQDA